VISQLDHLEMNATAETNALPDSPVGKIIVVDDEPELKNVLVKVLSAQGFEVTGCSSGAQALAELRQKEFDLLLTDLMMPEMDGIALMEAALKIDPHLIGIMMTGQGTIQTAVDAMKVGAFDYVLKPFRIQTVMPVLTRAINTRRLRMENLQLRETVAIYGLCQTISFTLDPQTVLSRLADAALQQSDADEVSILLPTSDGKELFVAAVRGEKRERLLGERVPLQESISSWVARERVPLILNGKVQDERFVALWPRPEIRSAVSVPMQVANKLVGIINLNVTNRLRPFTLGQMKALTILASTAAAALESASLYSQVRTTEEKYRSIFENATEGLFQSTSDGRLLTANPAMARILGYDSPEETIATITDIAHQLYVNPEDRAEAGRLQEENGTLEGFELEAYRKNGEKLWLSVNRRSVRNQTGEVLYFEGSLEDITARRRIEEEKRKTRQQYQSLVQSIDGIVWEADLRSLNFTFVSKQSERLLGYPPEQWLSDPDFWEDHLHPDDRSWALELCHDAMAKRTDHEFDYRMIAADGRVVWFRDNVTVDGTDNENPHLRGVMVDITERKLAEDELKKSEERYRDLVENAHDLIYEHDLKGNYTATNKAGERVTGYSLEESLKMNLAQTVAPDYLVRAQEMLRRKLAGESVTAYDLVVIAKDGSRVPIEVNTRLVLKDGVPVGVQGIARDITERKRVEEIQARRAAHALFRADVSAALAISHAPLRATLESSATAMVEHLGAAFARIWTLNREEDVLELQASAGMYTHLDGPHSRIPVGSFKIGKIAQERAPHITNEVQTDPRVGDKEWARREEMVAFAGYPLLLENRVLGVMAMFSREKLAEDTLDALASVADLVSQGIVRKRAEEGLRESEERYRLLFESNPQPMWVYDLETLAFLAVNKSAVRHYGYSREDFLAMTIKDIRPAEDLSALYDFAGRSSDGVDTAGIWRHLKKDGTIIEVEITSHLLAFDNRQAELILAHDITKRRRTEEALRESEARKRAILESAMDCIITMDQAGLVVDWNPAAEKTFGYTPAEAIGKEMALLIIPERFREQHRQGLARYLATGVGRVLGQRLELSAERNDGTELPVELTITRIESRGGSMFTGYLRDITDRKKAENRLSAQYAVTRALAESNTIDEGAAKILQAVCESLGWEYGALWTVDRGANVLRCSQIWQSQSAETGEFENSSRQLEFAPGIGLPGRVWKSSQPLWIADVVGEPNFPRSSAAARVGLHGACAFPIRFRSQILGVVEFFSRSIREPDPELLAMMITIGSQIGQFIERKRVETALSESEEQLRQSQKLEAIGQLAGGVAHDFNNLLTVIGGYSSILLGKLPPESPHRPSIEEIKKASDRASGLTRQLLAFSRKQILQPKVLDLNIVVTDLEKMVRRLIGEDIDLLTITSPGLGKVKADPGQIEQVLLNLIVNARDAMPGGGKLTIETRNVVHYEEYAARHAALPGPYVMLAVTDSGCGMDATIQPRVFEPFFTTKASGQGTGLGLATVYGIVKQSGGNIWIYSEVGKGSTFKIYLPRVDEVAEGEEEVISRSIPKGTEMILLVEDEEQVRTILKHILEGQGYNVLSASNGEEALSISQDLKLDIKLMITDVVMPQMSGRELAERLLSIRPTLPVLFMSGYTDDAIVRHGLLDEKLNFIQKPFDSASVARKVREVLDSQL
jgi:PAS domain S-box-containing protein